MSVPFYGDLGKSASDLFKKQFDLANKLSLKHSTKDGLTVEASAKVDSKKGVSGTAKGTLKNKHGKFEADHQTTGTLLFSGEFSKLADGLTVKATGGIQGPNTKGIPEGPTSSLLLKYTANNFFAGSLELGGIHQLKNSVLPTAKLTGVVSDFGVSVGGQVDLHKSITSFGDRKLDVGLSWATDEFTVAVGTEKDMTKLSASFIQQVNANYQIAARVTSKVDAPNPTVEFAAQNQLDRDTLLKNKFSTTGAFTNALRLNLNDPSAQVLLSSEYNVTKPNEAPKFGLGISLGEF